MEFTVTKMPEGAISPVDVGLLVPRDEAGRVDVCTSSDGAAAPGPVAAACGALGTTLPDAVERDAAGTPTRSNQIVTVRFGASE